MSRRWQHLGRLRQRAAQLRRFWRELTGEAGYDRYLAHARAHAPQDPVLSRREFERRRTDAAEADPRQGFRCC